jgi:hypothetical protein
LKLLNVTVLVFIASAVYFTFETYKGWPTIEAQQERARVYSVVIVAPQEGMTDGAIYYWVLEKKTEQNLLEKVFRYNTTMPYAPRAYFVEHTDENERLFSRAKTALEEGSLVFLDPPKKKDKNKGTGDGKGGQDGEQRNTGKESEQASEGNSDAPPSDYDADRIEIVTQEEYMPPKVGEQ